LAELDTWTTVKISLCEIDDDGKNIKSNWEEFLSTPSVIKLYEQYEAANELDSFCREYLGQPISGKTRKFQEKFFRYYEEADLVEKKSLESVVIVDPAKTTEEHSADTAIVGWSFDAGSGYLYLRDVDAGKIHVDDMYRRTAEMAKRIGARVIGVESTGIGEFIVHPFKTFLMRWGFNFEFVELKSKGQKGEKDNRIASLLPYYRQGRILHNKTCSRGLELQLLSFPFSRRKDISDAAAYITEMLSLGDRFFSPEHLATKKTLDEKFAALRESQPRPTRKSSEPSILDPTRSRQRQSTTPARMHKWETNRFEQLFGVKQCQS
jgi:hypothetical protein